MSLCFIKAENSFFEQCLYPSASVFVVSGKMPAKTCNYFSSCFFKVALFVDKNRPHEGYWRKFDCVWFKLTFNREEVLFGISLQQLISYTRSTKILSTCIIIDVNKKVLILYLKK